jgi:transcriptional regulator with XRE-family HTH domain
MSPTDKTRALSRGRLPDGSANPIDAYVGSRVRLRRTLLGMSQAKLGEALGLTFQQIQKYERGGNRVSASRLFDLCRVLGVSAGYFFEEMSDATKAASPAEVRSGKVHGRVAGPDRDPMLKRETLELVRAYFGIADPEVRKQVMAMAKALAGSK